MPIPRAADREAGNSPPRSSPSCFSRLSPSSPGGCGPSVLRAKIVPEIAKANIIDEIVDWNVALAEANEAERANLLKERPKFEARLQLMSFTADDRQFAESLLDKAAILAQNPDPLTAADHFSAVADQMQQRLEQAVGSDKTGEAAVWAQRLGSIDERGVQDRSSTRDTRRARSRGRRSRPTTPTASRPSRRCSTTPEADPNRRPPVAQEGLSQELTSSDEPRYRIIRTRLGSEYRFAGRGRFCYTE